MNGFYGGEYNTVGRFYTVAQANAHSWVEVYFNGLGWYTFDATPAGTASAPKARFIWLRSTLGYVRYKWLGAVAGYNSDLQEKIYGGIYSVISPAARPFRDSYRFFARAVGASGSRRTSPAGRMVAVTLVAAGTVAALFLAAAVAGFLRRVAGNALRAARDRAYPPFYSRFVKALRKRGYVRRADETPLELALRATQEGALAMETAQEVVSAYYRERFAGERLSGDDARRLEALVAASLGTRA